MLSKEAKNTGVANLTISFQSAPHTGFILELVVAAYLRHSCWCTLMNFSVSVAYRCFLFFFLLTNETESDLIELKLSK